MTLRGDVISLLRQGYGLEDAAVLLGEDPSVVRSAVDGVPNWADLYRMWRREWREERRAA